jgi:hypothetical protein
MSHRLYFLAVSLLAAFNPIAHAAWVEYGTDNKGVVHFYEPEVVSRNAAHVSIKERSYDPNTNSETIYRIELNCMQKTAAFTQVQMQVQNKTVNSDVPLSSVKTVPIKPGGLFNRLAINFC